MKKIFILIAGCFFAINVMAQAVKNRAEDQNKKTTIEKYCTTLKGENLTIMAGEKEIVSDILLANGTEIKTNGTVIKSDGRKIILKNGDCVDKEGNISESIVKDKTKKEESKVSVDK